MSLTGSGFNWSDKLIVTKSGRNNSRESTRALTSILSGRWTAIVDDWIISDNYETQSREAFQFRYAIQVKRARSVDGRQFFFFFLNIVNQLQNQVRGIRWWNRRPAEAAATQTNPFVHSYWRNWTQPINILHPMLKHW